MSSPCHPAQAQYAKLLGEAHGERAEQVADEIADKHQLDLAAIRPAAGSETGSPAPYPGEHRAVSQQRPPPDSGSPSGDEALKTEADLLFTPGGSGSESRKLRFS